MVIYSLFSQLQVHAACPWVGTACADTISEHSTDPSLPHGSGGSAEKGQLTGVTALRGSQVGDLAATAEAGLTF